MKRADTTDAELLTVVLSVRFSELELEQVEQAAEAAGLSRHAYMRARILLLRRI